MNAGFLPSTVSGLWTPALRFNLETYFKVTVYGVALLKPINGWCPCEFSRLYFLQIPQWLSHFTEKNKTWHRKWHKNRPAAVSNTALKTNSWLIPAKLTVPALGSLCPQLARHQTCRCRLPGNGAWFKALFSRPILEWPKHGSIEETSKLKQKQTSFIFFKNWTKKNSFKGEIIWTAIYQLFNTKQYICLVFYKLKENPTASLPVLAIAPPSFPTPKDACSHCAAGPAWNASKTPEIHQPQTAKDAVLNQFPVENFLWGSWGYHLSLVLYKMWIQNKAGIPFTGFNYFTYLSNVMSLGLWASRNTDSCQLNYQALNTNNRLNHLTIAITWIAHQPIPHHLRSTQWKFIWVIWQVRILHHRKKGPNSVGEVLRYFDNPQRWQKCGQSSTSNFFSHFHTNLLEKWEVKTCWGKCRLLENVL